MCTDIVFVGAMPPTAQTCVQILFDLCPVQLAIASSPPVVVPISALSGSARTTSQVTGQSMTVAHQFGVCVIGTNADRGQLKGNPPHRWPMEMQIETLMKANNDAEDGY
ncbi:hypothetical protein T01_11223 [Trichinella spiralis]|uniref:Uncharacterized protein n=1 Tax=Trichinella spiralis TaxID=6334 RepID=A0A0V1B3A2_TRISP|nr:hypothetical protein T01_11223 [Trichinella spiralis]